VSYCACSVGRILTCADNLLGHIYTLNFSTPFDTTQNMSAVFGILETGGGDSNNRAPNYEDGALLYNNEQFFLYGGLLQRTGTAEPPPGDQVLSYEKYPQGPSLTFSPDFINKPLGENTTRYVAYGGAASAPSENLAWYFSGLRSPTWGPINTVAGAKVNTSASEVARTLITLDMAERRAETFTNDTLPSKIPGRANPELVWVPVGERGILVALGGVVFPDFVSVVGKSTDEEASVRLPIPFSSPGSNPSRKRKAPSSCRPSTSTMLPARSGIVKRPLVVPASSPVDVPLSPAHRTARASTSTTTVATTG
jgi:hypothetical protein